MKIYKTLAVLAIMLFATQASADTGKIRQEQIGESQPVKGQVISQIIRYRQDRGKPVELVQQLKSGATVRELIDLLLEEGK